MSEQDKRQPLRPLAGGMVSVDIIDATDRLKAKPQWSSEDRAAVSLVKDDALNILLMAFKKGARLAEHRTKGPIAIQVLSGRVRFSAGTEHVELTPGNMAALDRDVVHELEALEESTVLLTTAIG